MRILSTFLLLCFASFADASDLRYVTLEQLVQYTKFTYWDDPSTLRRFATRVRELIKSADSIFAESIERDLATFEQDIIDIKTSSKSLLPLFTPPPRSQEVTKKIIIGYVELLQHIQRVSARSGIIDAKLRTYYKGKGVDKVLERITFDVTLLRDAMLSSDGGLTRFLHQEL